MNDLIEYLIAQRDLLISRLPKKLQKEANIWLEFHSNETDLEDFIESELSDKNFKICRQISMLDFYAKDLKEMKDLSFNLYNKLS